MIFFALPTLWTRTDDTFLFQINDKRAKAATAVVVRLPAVFCKKKKRHYFIQEDYRVDEWYIGRE